MKIKLHSNKSMSRSFATMHKLKNVGRARGRAITIHNNASATAHLPARKQTTPYAPLTLPAPRGNTGGPAATRPRATPPATPPAPTVVRGEPVGVPAGIARGNSTPQGFDSSPRNPTPNTRTPLPGSMFARLMQVSPSSANYSGRFDPWIAGGLGDRTQDEVETYLRANGV